MVEWEFAIVLIGRRECNRWNRYVMMCISDDRQNCKNVMRMMLYHVVGILSSWTPSCGHNHQPSWTHFSTNSMDTLLIVSPTNHPSWTRTAHCKWTHTHPSWTVLLLLITYYFFWSPIQWPCDQNPLSITTIIRHYLSQPLSTTHHRGKNNALSIHYHDSTKNSIQEMGVFESKEEKEEKEEKKKIIIRIQRRKRRKKNL